MSESLDRHEPEPELAFLDGIESEPALDAGELDALFAGVQGRVEKSGARRLRGLAEQPTSRRRLFALICFVLIVVGLGALLPRSEPAEFPPIPLAIVMGTFGSLLVVAVLVAFRPIYVPALSPLWKIGLGVAAIAAAFTVALVPELHTHTTSLPASDAFLAHSIPCLSFGLLAGLPGYAFLRLLDRGAPFGRLLAGAAAGLAGNLVLELRCPVGGTDHLMLGHAMVVVAFIVGVVLVERVIARTLAARRDR